MQFILENLGTIAVLAVLAAVTALVVFKLRKDKKAGKSPTCGCDCGGCAMSGICHSGKQEEKK